MSIQVSREVNCSKCEIFLGKKHLITEYIELENNVDFEDIFEKNQPLLTKIICPKCKAETILEGFVVPF